jgi:hypothetical protein
MNIIRKKETVKNSIKQEYNLPQNLELLNKWTIPKIEPKVIYQLGTFEKLGLKQVVKTTEQSISLDNEEMIIKLLSEKDLQPYRQTHKFIHIGLIQIAFKPLTLEGLPESFIAALRDGRNLDWKKSLMGLIQSSLAHGPVYFNVYPNLQLSLSDINILEAVTLNVKTHGYNYIPGSEVICICYRIYYKPLYTLNPQCRLVDKPVNETILIETNFSQSNITTRRSIKWEEIPLPESWIIERAIPSVPKINDNITQIIQTPEGNIQIEMERTSSNSRPSSSRLILPKTKSFHSYISPLDGIVETPSRFSTSQIKERFSDEESSKENTVEKLYKNKDNIVKGIYNNQEQDITESEMNFSI